MNEIPQIFPREPDLNKRIAEKILALRGQNGEELLHGLVPVKVRRREFSNSPSFRRVNMAIYYFSPQPNGEGEEKKIVARRLPSEFDVATAIEVSGMWCDAQCRAIPPVLDMIEEYGDLPANDWDDPDIKTA